MLLTMTLNVYANDESKLLESECLTEGQAISCFKMFEIKQKGNEPELAKKYLEKSCQLTTGRECILNTKDIPKYNFQFKVSDVLPHIERCVKKTWEIKLVNKKSKITVYPKDGNCIYLSHVPGVYKSKCVLTTKHIEQLKSASTSIESFLKQFDDFLELGVCTVKSSTK